MSQDEENKPESEEKFSDDENMEQNPRGHEETSEKALLQNLFGEDDEEEDEVEELKPQTPGPSETTQTIKRENIDAFNDDVTLSPTTTIKTESPDAPQSNIDNEGDNEIVDTEPQPEQVIVNLEKMPFPEPPPAANLFFVKPTGFELEPKPFEPDIFQAPGEEKKDGEDSESDMKKRFKKILPTVRWRWGLNEKDNPERQSNSRLVRWSDGSYTLFIGKDSFTVNTSSFTDYHHLFVRQRKDVNSESFLHCHGVLSQKLAIQPTTTSFLKLQAQDSVLKAMDKKRNRQIYTGGLGDPEKDKQAKEKLEQGKIDLRQQYARPREELSAAYLEGSDDKQADARIMAAKRGNSYDDDVEDEYGELEEPMEDVEEDLEDDGDDDGEDIKKRKPKKQRR